MSEREPPVPGPEAGRHALRALFEQRSVLASLEALHHSIGDVFQIPLPGFNPVVLVGPEANRFVSVTAREDLRWRSEGDPVTELLDQGILVTDGEFHDKLRRSMNPALHKSLLADYQESMWRRTDQVICEWHDGARMDMLVEMRKIALLIFMETLFGVDITADMPSIWRALLRTLAYISPGAWVIFPGIPRPGYAWALQKMDGYLYRIIAERRASQNPSGKDLLGLLIASGFNDKLIRDQLLTMLIAGHDTSTALLAWTLSLLGGHPKWMRRIQEEVVGTLGDESPTLEKVEELVSLELVIKESLRLYPPIHIGNRIAAEDLEFGGYRIPAGKRVVYSIYLTHRHPAYWERPADFLPERFGGIQDRQRPHYAYVPFGGGPRNCIGMPFAQVEVKIVLARIFQTFTLEMTPADYRKVQPHMGATLEPRPGVWMRVHRR